jgi:hypothetical protein
MSEPKPNYKDWPIGIFLGRGLTAEFSWDPSGLLGLVHAFLDKKCTCVTGLTVNALVTHVDTGALGLLIQAALNSGPGGLGVDDGDIKDSTNEKLRTITDTVNKAISDALGATGLAAGTGLGKTGLDPALAECDIGCDRGEVKVPVNVLVCYGFACVKISIWIFVKYEFKNNIFLLGLFKHFGVWDWLRRYLERLGLGKGRISPGLGGDGYDKILAPSSGRLHVDSQGIIRPFGVGGEFNGLDFAVPGMDGVRQRAAIELEGLARIVRLVSGVDIFDAIPLARPAETGSSGSCSGCKGGSSGSMIRPPVFAAQSQFASNQQVSRQLLPMSPHRVGNPIGSISNGISRGSS